MTAVLVRTDDQVYRVDSVWLGPPRATFPWRARYVSYGVGLLVMTLVMFVQRRIGIGLDFFSVAWSLIFTVVITRFLGKRIGDERPLGQVVALFRHELKGPRRRTAVAGGPVRSDRVAVRARQAAKTKAPKRRASASTTPASTAPTSTKSTTARRRKPSKGRTRAAA